MTELALTRIFSVVMYYHFAFLAISIALFGLSASGVFAYVARRRLERYDTGTLLAVESVVYALFTLVALFALVRMRIGLVYSRQNLILMLTTYALAALPFFTGGLVLTLAISRMSGRINAVYASDLIGAAAGCLVLIPLLDRVGAPGVVLTAAALALTAGVLFASRASRLRFATVGGTIMAVALAGQLSGVAVFDVGEAKGHVGDQVLFTKWNSFSRIGVYERTHDNWSLSPTFTGTVPHTRYMDIDAAASTPILQVTPDLSNVQYLKYELTAVAYRLKPPGFSALVIGPGGGRDLVSALVFGAGHVDGVEINPIIANDVMRDQFREFSGGIYTHPRVRIAVDDGRSFVRGSTDRYDIIQASLVDTWAATAAGAYTLTENTLYTVEAFNDYLDHLTDDGIVTMTRWVIDGLRLVSLAQEAGAARGWDVSKHLAVVQYRPRADVPAEEVGVHAGRDRDARRGRQAARVQRDLRADLRRRGDAAAADRLGRRHGNGRLPAADPRRRPAAVLRQLQTGHPADDRRSAVLLSHDEARGSVSSRVRPGDAVRQRIERAADAHGNFDRARRALRPRAARVCGRRGRAALVFVAGVLRRTRRGLHVDRGVDPSAVRAAARPPRLLADGDAVLTAAWHGNRRGVEPASARSHARPVHRDHAGRDRRDQRRA